MAGGPAFTNSAGVPWTAAYVDSIGDPTCDLRSNIAAEARARLSTSVSLIVRTIGSEGGARLPDDAGDFAPAVV